ERLAAMREAGAQLMARDRLGRDFFARGLTENVARLRRVTYAATLLDLMQGYARIRTRDDFQPYTMDRAAIFTMERALKRMRELIAVSGGWTVLSHYLPEGWNADPVRRRSATAATFAASLEMVRLGQIELRQDGAFAPIEVRRKETPR
ncbi:MAG: segregation/condensation protein A, partial [Pseudomonadota bacterium]